MDEEEDLNIDSDEIPESQSANAAGIQKVEYPEAKNRCQAVTSQGQCLNQAMPGMAWCTVHGGNVQAKSQEKASLSNYRLGLWQAKLERQTSSTQLKSLRDEIGILRILLEEKMNKCQDVTDLILQSAGISDLVVKIEKLVTSCNKLESSLGELMDKQAILRFAGSVISIITETLGEEPEKVNEIASKILAAVGGLSNGCEI